MIEISNDPIRRNLIAGASRNSDAAATDLVEFAKTHLPILLGTQVTVSRKEIPRPVNRIH